MPDIVKILLGLAGFGVVASVVMIMLNIIAGRSAAENDDEVEEKEEIMEPEEEYTRSYTPPRDEQDNLVFTPLGEEETYESVGEAREEEKAEDDEVTVREEPEPLTFYKTEEPAPRKKAVITPAVVEYEEPETVHREEEPVVEEPLQEESPEILIPVMPAEKPVQKAPKVQPEPEYMEELIASAVPMRAGEAEYVNAVIGDIRLSIGNAQHIGSRDQQQDAFAITPLEEKDVVAKYGVMAVICDGMGGLENGAEAANLGAINFMRNYLRQERVTGESLLEAVTETNSVVYDTFADGETPAGTTLAAASIMPGGLRFVSVGDSHIYLYRRGRIYQINRDHNYFSELMEQVKAGKMTLQEAQTHPERAHLTSYVGMRRLEKVDYNTEVVALREGDRVLLCTDGLFKTLSLDEIASTIAASDKCDVQDRLMEAVLRKNKRRQDNVTIVVLYCDRV